MNEELVKEWAVKAEEDYLTVEELFKMHVRRFATIICFHSQQCAEKYLKALLIACNIEPPRTYSLETLLDLIVSEVPELEQYRDMLTDLLPRTAYNIDIREWWQPGTMPDIVPGLYKNCVKCFRRY